ncbi:MAG: ferritin-like domain-containing protein [Deltaproteobacteria bacterium]|nr:ferritin-like domain-containing protein [Deltaproteobacteria bacterium]MBK9648721.1 ferritin-like domain-containing protein [Deltaproteobacteria bacterium]
MTTPPEEPMTERAAAPILLDLRREAQARQPDLSALPPLSEPERQMAIRTWRGRMVNEHISAQVWAGLVPSLMRAGAPPAALAELPAAIADELRHAEQCAGVVLALGGVPVAPLPELAPVPLHEEVSAIEGAARNIISVGCMSETIAVSIIRAEHAELDDGPLATLLGEILADEVSHARFGWRTLGLLMPRLDAAARARTSRYLVDAFAHQVRHEVPRLPRGGEIRPELGQAGVCDGGFARGLFVDTIQTVIVPGLTQAGLNAQAAWDEAKAETAAVFLR